MIQIPKQLQNPEYRFLRLTNKSKAPIPGIAWKSTTLEHNNIELLNHLEQGGNYGVIGGYGNLCLLDIDDLEISKKLSKEKKGVPIMISISSFETSSFSPRRYLINIMSLKIFPIASLKAFCKFNRSRSYGHFSSSIEFNAIKRSF